MRNAWRQSLEGVQLQPTHQLELHTCAIVRLVPVAEGERAQVDEKVFAAVVARAFSARRKTLRNALKLDAAALKTLGLEPKLRPENLSLDDYVRVADFVSRISAR